MELLVVPTMLAFLVFLFNKLQKDTELKIAELRRNEEIKAAEQRANFDREMALVHKSKSRHNPFVGSEKLCHLVTLGHTEVSHFVESSTANQCLRCLRFKQTRREVVAENGFQAKDGCLRQ
jgi:hypothetical protein